MTKNMIFKKYKTYDEMSRGAADLIVEVVKNKPDALLCFPAGESPAGVLKYLVADAKAGKVDFSHCNFVGLDEWVGLGKGDDGSCTEFLYEHFFGPMKTYPGKVIFFDARAADLDAECEKVNDFIAEKGPLDVMMVGIGMNGHIGLNEPGADFNLYAHHARLAAMTVEVGQKYFKEKTELHEGITLGLKHLQESKLPLLVASGIKKAPIIAKALEETVNEQLPASIFQTLPKAYVFLDEDAASELSRC